MKRLSTRKPGKSKGLKLIRSKGSITGVSAGLAEYFGIDVRSVRLGIAALSAFIFFTGWGIFKLLGVAIYAGMAAMLPRESAAIAGRTPYAALEAEEREESSEIGAADTLVVCSNCSTVSKPHAVFCHACGTRL